MRIALLVLLFAFAVDAAPKKARPSPPPPQPRCLENHPECPTGMVFCGYVSSPSGAPMALCEPAQPKG